MLVIFVARLYSISADARPAAQSRSVGVPATPMYEPLSVRVRDTQVPSQQAGRAV